MSSAGYGDIGAREMADSDLLVGARDADVAMGVLVGAGLSRYRDDIPIELVKNVMHAAEVSGLLGVVDLHWALLHYSRDLGADEALHERAVVADLADGLIRVLAPSYLLAHVLAHGRLPDTRWMVDAIAVLAQGGTNPHAVAEMASNRRYLAVVRRNVEALDRVLATEQVDALRRGQRSPSAG